MKLADDSKAILEDGPRRILAAIEGAASVAATELSALPDKLLAATKAAMADLSAAAAQTSTAAAQLDGPSVVAEFRAAVPPPIARIQAAVNAAASCSGGLSACNGSIQPLLSTAQTDVTRAADTPQTFAALLPDLKTQLDAQKAYASKLDAIASRASDATAVVQAYGDSLLSGPLGPAHEATLTAKREAATAKIAALDSSIQSEFQGADAAMVQAGAAIDSAIAAALEKLPSAKRSILDPLTESQASFQEAKAAFDKESKATDAGLGEASSKIEPELATLQKAVTDSEERLKQAGSQVDGSATQASAKTQAAMKVLDALDASVQASVDAINAALGKVPHEADSIKALVDAINAQAEVAKASLMSIPDNFNDISGQISAAVATIQGAKDSIPALAEQATTALTSAESSLDSAGTLCDTAIATCTKYMMKAPLLIPARLLFVGVKATIPGIKAAIVAAKGGITSASAAACKLMDAAAAVVVKLEPVLKQVIEKLRLAVTAIVTLVGTLQQALIAAVGTLDKLVATLQATFATIPPRIDVILDKIRAQVMAQEAKSKPAPVIQKAQVDVDALAAETYPPIQAQLDSTIGGVGAALKASQADIQAAGTPVPEGFDTVSSRVQQLTSDVNKAADEFVAILNAAVELMAQIRAKAKTYQAEAAARVQAHIQAALSEIHQLHEMAISAAMADVGVQTDATGTS